MLCMKAGKGIEGLIEAVLKAAGKDGKAKLSITNMSSKIAGSEVTIKGQLEITVKGAKRAHD